MGADLKSIGFQKDTVADKSGYVEKLREQVGRGFTDKPTDTKKRTEMGKDDFIKLMTAQMKHQDPINPMKNEEMAAQLAQFSSLEQMLNMNQNLEKMANAQKPQEKVWAASLIGKSVLTDSSNFKLEKGAGVDLKFNLQADTEKTTLSVVNEKGEVLRDIELAKMQKGDQKHRWDGKDKDGKDVAPGLYKFRINAVGANNAPVQVKTATNGLVSGVVFENNQALLVVDGNKIPLNAVDKIEQEAGSASVKKAAAAELPAPALGQAQQTSSDNNLSATAATNGSVNKNNLSLADVKNALQNNLGTAKINNEEEEDSNSLTLGGTGVWNPNL